MQHLRSSAQTWAWNWAVMARSARSTSAANCLQPLHVGARSQRTEMAGSQAMRRQSGEQKEAWHWWRMFLHMMGFDRSISEWQSQKASRPSWHVAVMTPRGRFLAWAWAGTASATTRASTTALAGAIRAPWRREKPARLGIAGFCAAGAAWKRGRRKWAAERPAGRVGGFNAYSTGEHCRCGARFAVGQVSGPRVWIRSPHKEAFRLGSLYAL